MRQETVTVTRIARSRAGRTFTCPWCANVEGERVTVWKVKGGDGEGRNRDVLIFLEVLFITSDKPQQRPPHRRLLLTSY
jgi:hypothetical protein